MSNSAEGRVVVITGASDTRPTLQISGTGDAMPGPTRLAFRCAITAAVIVGVIAMSRRSASSQSSAPPVITISAAEIQSVVESVTGGAGSDQQMKVVDLGTYNLGVSILKRGPTKAGASVGAVRHERVTEVFYVVSGSGTLVVGGEVVNLKPMAPDSPLVMTVMGPTTSGTFKQPAMTRPLSAGDVAIVPAGVFHGFIDIADHIEYLSIRPDVEKVLPAGYINSVLKK
jgi:mannose-6-phosphate isomerase-like protein (cupin superfamily)